MPWTISPMRSLYSSILALALGVAHFLHDHLLGGLGGDAREIDRRQGLGDDVADLCRGIARARVFQADLDLVVVDQLHDMQIARDMGLAGLGIDLDPDVVLAAVVRLGGALHRLFHRGQHDRLVDRFVARDRVGDLQEFEPVRGYCHRPCSVLLVRARALRAFKSSSMSCRSVRVSRRRWRLNGKLTRAPCVSIATSLPSSPRSLPRTACGPSTRSRRVRSSPHGPPSAQNPSAGSAGGRCRARTLRSRSRLRSGLSASMKSEQRVRKRGAVLRHPCCRRAARP